MMNNSGSSNSSSSSSGETACAVSARAVADRLYHAEGVEQKAAFDPVTIAAIAGVIVSLIKMAMECSKSKAQAIASVNSPGPLGRWRLRRAVRLEVRKRKMGESMAPKIHRAILASLPLEESHASALMTECEAMHGTRHAPYGTGQESAVEVPADLVGHVLANLPDDSEVAEALRDLVDGDGGENAE